MTPNTQEAASPAAALQPSSYGEAVKLALSLGGGVVGTYALVYYGALTDFKPAFVAICAAAALAYAAAVWRRFGSLAAWAAVFLLHVSLLCAVPSKIDVFLGAATVDLAAPALVYGLCLALRCRPAVFALALLACLGADLWRYAGLDSSLYEGQPSLASRGVDVSLAAPDWPATRAASPPEWLSEDGHAVLYPELVLRRAFSFSAPMRHNWYAPWAVDRELELDRLSPLPPLSFGEALGGRRWAVHMLGKDYFRLIHSGLPAGVIRDFLAVDRPVFQFKAGAVLVPDADLNRLFEGLSARQAADLLSCYAVVHDPIPSVIPVEEALARSRGCRTSSFSLSFPKRTDDELEGVYAASGPGVLYWSDLYDPRWRAYVDGAPATLARAGGAFKALPLPAGRHRLRLAYEPRLFELGLWLHFGAAAACVLAALACWITAIWKSSRGSAENVKGKKLV